jgi:cobalt-zinc-cadmium efflux system protein
MSAHDHGHDHHGHPHGVGGHSHAPADFGRAFAVGTTLNAGFVVAELIFGFFAHSLALVADAGHNFGDVVGLLLAWFATSLGRKHPTERYTYGFRRSSILAAFLNALILLVSMGALGWEALRRLNLSTPVEANTVIWVAAAGIFVNGATAAMFVAGRKHDLNIRAAFLHMAGDALLSAGVVVAGFVIRATHWLWLDPVVSLLIVALILWSTWGLFRDSLNLSLDAVPPGIDLPGVRKFLKGLPGVVDAHDLHIWGLSTTETALTAHLVVENNVIDGELLHHIHHELEDDFNIQHATIQLEPRGERPCVTRRCD